MGFYTLVILGAVLLFAIVLLALEFGFRTGRRHEARLADKSQVGLSAIEGAVFGLLGLLIAFTFSGGLSRFDDRRHLIVEEANAIGTAYLRLDLLPASTQPALREDFRQYVNARLLAYRKLPDFAAAKAELDRANTLQQQIWQKAMSAVKTDSSPAVTTLVVGALNSMIDVTSSRSMSLLMHPPAIVYIMLGLLIFVSASLAGYGMAQNKNRSWFHMLCFAMILSATTYVILDIEFPRVGLVRVDAADQILIDVQNSMR